MNSLVVIARTVLPISYTGKLYLIQELQKYGADTNRIPDPCLKELTAAIIKTSKALAYLKKCSWKILAGDHIESAAGIISCLLKGKYLHMGSPYVEILARYGLVRPEWCLDQVYQRRRRGSGPDCL